MQEKKETSAEFNVNNMKCLQTTNFYDMHHHISTWAKHNNTIPQKSPSKKYFPGGQTPLPPQKKTTVQSQFGPWIIDDHVSPQGNRTNHNQRRRRRSNQRTVKRLTVVSAGSREKRCLFHKGNGESSSVGMIIILLTMMFLKRFLEIMICFSDVSFLTI